MHNFFKVFLFRDTRSYPLQHQWPTAAGSREYKPLFKPFPPIYLHLKLLKVENSKLCVSNQSCRLLADIVLSVAVLFTFTGVYT